ncbi:Cytochrome c [Aquisphaera giovannonii]|uniref:Cytochrome c n=1 Tax=Aquisphaera giovannonii TaxID=406548 RepID=A0A5B9W0N1_9BACT|nr:PVC-type heme-binding CxxCH protein [Aquisphaera giovannonii]QEH33774.1 Cytochrome c [Aquisphaera giovannonii]
MRSWHSPARAAVLSLAAAWTTATALAQKPAPVEDVSSFPHRSPDEERKALHVPPGFEVQLVAAEPDIHKPLNLAFDDRGRLWITDTVEYPYPVKPGAKGRDTVKILSDFGPDGRARSISTFADGLNIPIGLLPLPSTTAALVHNIPDIYLMRDTDGDGRADSRDVLYGIFGHRDTHGMTNAFTWGIDGWVYACHGYANDSRVQGKDRKPIAMNSGNTYRMRPDGSHAEYVTHGQVNPFGLAFDPLGNLYSADCHSRPVYQLLRGAWYPSFGKPHDGLGFGPEMVDYDHGSTGIGGISYYAAEQFPEAYRGTVFVGNVVTNRINHDRIEWHGSTPKGIEQPDFVWSEDNWFRPVDIELGPDGALYVADFYNRIIGHYEVPLTHPGRDRTSGRVWRIVYKGGGQPAASAWKDWTKAAVAELVSALKDPNLAVRVSATNQLVERGGDEAASVLAGVLTGSAAGPVRSHALWALQRLGRLDDEQLSRTCRDERDRDLRVHTMKVSAERPELSAKLRGQVVARLKDSDAFVRRAAAEALGSHPDPAQIRPLLDLLQATTREDSHLLHVVRMALRDQLKERDSWKALASTRLTDRDRRCLADVSVGVHAEEAATFLMSYVRNNPVDSADLRRFGHHIARYGDADAVASIAAFAKELKGPPKERLELFQEIQQGADERTTPIDPGVRGLAAAVCRGWLDSKRDDQIGLAVQAARDFPLPELIPDLSRLAAGETAEAVRSEALHAIAAIDPRMALPLLRDLTVGSGSPIAVREAAAVALANLDRPEAQKAVLDALATAPEQLQSTIAAALARRSEGAASLLQTIESGKASPRILQERRVVIGLENAGIPELGKRIATLLKGLPPADQKLKDLFDRRRSAYASKPHDASRGARVFEKNCGICHQIEGKGARVGPQLDGIGSRGLDRLMEDILDPNRNVDQSFRVTNLALENGRVVSGLLLREEGEILILADAQGKEVRVPRSNVEERSTAQISPMPANMAEQIPEDDFRDLLDFLLRHREDKAPKP